MLNEYKKFFDKIEYIRCQICKGTISISEWARKKMLLHLKESHQQEYQEFKVMQKKEQKHRELDHFLDL